jgi:hypothetical protein
MADGKAGLDREVGAIDGSYGREPGMLFLVASGRDVVLFMVAAGSLIR